MDKRGRRANREGFTLIEILIVVAIIALLATILFPVFGRARENAKRASCLNNMKQLGLGLMQYSQDYDERFPTFMWNKDTGTLASAVAPLTNYFTWDSAIYPYVRNEQIFKCPSAYIKNTRTAAINIWVTGYTDYFYGQQQVNGTNAMTKWGVSGTTTYSRTIAGIPRTANTALLVEVYANTQLTNETDTSATPVKYNLRARASDCAAFGNAHAANSPWGDYAGYTRDATGALKKGEGTGVHINDTFIILFCDGHAKAMDPTPPTDGSFLMYPAG